MHTNTQTQIQVGPGAKMLLEILAKNGVTDDQLRVAAAQHRLGYDEDPILEFDGRFNPDLMEVEVHASKTLAERLDDAGLTTILHHKEILALEEEQEERTVVFEGTLSRELFWINKHKLEFVSQWPQWKEELGVRDATLAEVLALIESGGMHCAGLDGDNFFGIFNDKLVIDGVKHFILIGARMNGEPAFETYPVSELMVNLPEWQVCICTPVVRR